jgi:hypothetical protein
LDLICFALLCFALLCFALLCFYLLSLALLGFAWLKKKRRRKNGSYYPKIDARPIVAYN